MIEALAVPCSHGAGNQHNHQPLKMNSLLLQVQHLTQARIYLHVKFYLCSLYLYLCYLCIYLFASPSIYSCILLLIYIYVCVYYTNIDILIPFGPLVLTLLCCEYLIFAPISVFIVTTISSIAHISTLLYFMPVFMLI